MTSFFFFPVTHNTICLGKSFPVRTYRPKMFSFLFFVVVNSYVNSFYGCTWSLTAHLLMDILLLRFTLKVKQTCTSMCLSACVHVFLLDSCLEVEVLAQSKCLCFLGLNLPVCLSICDVSWDSFLLLHRALDRRWNKLVHSMHYPDKFFSHILSIYSVNKSWFFSPSPYIIILLHNSINGEINMMFCSVSVP